MSIDLDVQNYTMSEMMAIVGLVDDELYDEDKIVSKTDSLIERFSGSNPSLSEFFQEVQNQLLIYSDTLNGTTEEQEGGDLSYGEESNEAIYPPAEKQLTQWYTNEALTQQDPNQVAKITQRKQKIDVYGNQHVPMDREQIATTDTYAVPVKQDSLNPNLKNTITRFINIDSQFRQYANVGDSTSSDFTLDLSDTLKDALKISLYSYQIPYTWYAIDHVYGNTCFWVSDVSSSIVVAVSVTPGNYSPSSFVLELTAQLSIAGFTFGGGVVPVVYNAANGLLTLKLINATYVDPLGTGKRFTVSTTTQLIFFDFQANLRCTRGCGAMTNHYYNTSLGWLMGYRVPFVAVLAAGNTGTAVLDLNGTKYLILVLDDYNQNHVNNSLISITQVSNVLKMPSYYSTDLPQYCLPPGVRNNTLVAEGDTNGLLIAGKYENDYTPTQVVLPSAPRTLTSAQLYTINSVNANNNNLTNYLATAPTSSDILAVLPIKVSAGLAMGSLLVEFSGSLQDNSRVYFGPVNIERMAVKLLDDKGNLLNMNGGDWCFTLICECLYQY